MINYIVIEKLNEKLSEEDLKKIINKKLFKTLDILSSEDCDYD